MFHSRTGTSSTRSTVRHRCRRRPKNDLRRTTSGDLPVGTAIRRSPPPRASPTDASSSRSRRSHAHGVCAGQLVCVCVLVVIKVLPLSYWCYLVTAEFIVFVLGLRQGHGSPVCCCDEYFNFFVSSIVTPSSVSLSLSELRCSHLHSTLSHCWFATTPSGLHLCSLVRLVLHQQHRYLLPVLAHPEGAHRRHSCHSQINERSTHHQCRICQSSSVSVSRSHPRDDCRGSSEDLDFMAPCPE